MVKLDMVAMVKRLDVVGNGAMWQVHATDDAREIKVNFGSSGGDEVTKTLAVEYARMKFEKVDVE